MYVMMCGNVEDARRVYEKMMEQKCGGFNCKICSARRERKIKCFQECWKNAARDYTKHDHIGSPKALEKGKKDS
jgi:hypothetical protein